MAPSTDDLVAENQRLGRVIDEARAQRRAINAEIEQRRKTAAAAALLEQLQALGVGAATPPEV